MSIGNMLRERREELGWDLPEVASYLRIRLPYLEAIEAEDYAVLPGSAFTIGFIRSYAHHLGFDSEKVLAQFRKDSAEAAERPALVMRVPVGTSRAPTGRIVAIALVLLALIWIGWAVFAGHDREADEQVPGVPDRLNPAPVQNKSITTANPEPPEGSGTEGEADEAANDMQEPGKDSSGPFAIANAPSVNATATNYTVSGVPSSTSQASHIEIRAIDDAWVQVVDDTGASIFTGILHPGDKFPVPAGKAYTLTTGNAGGVELALDGVAGQPLGETGRIMRGIPLDPAHIAAPLRKQ